MPSKNVGPIVVNVLTGAADVLALYAGNASKLAAVNALAAALGNRVCAEGGMLEDASLPRATYQVTSNAADLDMDNVADGYFADVSITFTAGTYAECDALTSAAAVALQDLRGTVAIIVVTGSQVDDVTDEPNGPVDLDGQQVFQAEISLTVGYQ